MKKHFQKLMILVFFITFENVFSFSVIYNDSTKCRRNLIEYQNFYKSGDLDKAYRPWLLAFNSCRKPPIAFYSRGQEILQKKFDKSTPLYNKLLDSLIHVIFRKRIAEYPQKLAKVYNDWATSLIKRDKPSNKILSKIDSVFGKNAHAISARNLHYYYNEKVRDQRDYNYEHLKEIYDKVSDALKEKKHFNYLLLDSISQKSDSSKDSLKLKIYKANLETIGFVQYMIEESFIKATTFDCQQLLPLYEAAFEKNANNLKWIKRAATRLSISKCTKNKIYKKIVEVYAAKESSPQSFKLILPLLKSNQKYNNPKYFNSIEQLKDPNLKAEYYYVFAEYYHDKSLVSSRKFINKVLENNPKFGEAYLLLSRLYASSANTCGNDEFSKRMVYVLAAEKAKLASIVDPSMTAKAKKYVKAYLANGPDPRRISMIGEKFKVDCWIGESFTVPKY